MNVHFENKKSGPSLVISNSEIKELNLENSPKLDALWCPNNLIDTLSLRTSTELRLVDLSETNISELDFFIHK